jgi:cytochrome c
MKFYVNAVLVGGAALVAAACSQPPATTPVAAPAVTEKTVEIQPSAPVPGTPSPEFASLPAPYNAADYARGRRTFKLCQSCHVVEAGGGNLVGPNLNDLFGRTAGTVAGFDYSAALAGAGFAWSPEKLDEWLAGPNTFLPGNRMSFAGVRKPEDRAAVIAYLMVETAKPAPAP